MSCNFLQAPSQTADSSYWLFFCGFAQPLIAFISPVCYSLIMQVTVEIPDQFVEQLVPAGRDAARLLLEESVAGAYRNGRLTMEQVRQLLGFGTRMQVDAFLQQHEVYDYTVEDLDKDMATLNRVLAAKSR